MKKKILFIDRDGTIILETQDEQIDSLEKLELLPHVIGTLNKAVAWGYELVMVTNQDGLGTDSFPEDTFWPAQEKLLRILSGEGIIFSAVFIDRSFEYENLPTRKPGTAMLKSFLEENDIDFEKSFAIGDRINDIRLARNLGCRSIHISESGYSAQLYPKHQDSALTNPENILADHPDFSVNGWESIQLILKDETARRSSLERNTAETRIKLTINLDGKGEHHIKTGLDFYDHMLDQLSRHSGIDIDMLVEGDLQVDEHHTIEDSAIALGSAIRTALGDKRGMERYAFVLPMDEALVSCAIDFSGRAWCIFKGTFDREYVGDFPTEMLSHWMHSFSEHAGLNLNMEILEGTNTHHKVEAGFKALARCLKDALRINGDRLPSTKGIL